MDKANDMAKLYAEGFTYAEIGKKYKLSRQRVHQILVKYKLVSTRTEQHQRNRTNRQFWAKVAKTKNCWIWTGHIDHVGYGKFRYDKESRFAHRYSKSLVEKLDPDLEIDHLCKVKHCVNPDHLEQVTHSVNMLRAYDTKKNLI